MYDPRANAENEIPMCGRPLGVTSSDLTDFSGCYFQYGTQTMAIFDMTVLGDLSDANMVFTVSDGQPVAMTAPFDLQQTMDGFFVGGDYDGDYVYAIRDNDFVQVGQVACAAMDGEFSDKNTPEAVWKKYESSIREGEEQTEGYDTSIFISRVVTGDYDGDGRQEAFAILEAPEDEWSTSWAHIYYISPNGYIIYVRGYANAGVMYGFLRGRDQPELLSAGNQKFLLWELDAGGSGSTTLIFGVRDGAPYEPYVSGGYMMFQQEGSGYLGLTSDFSGDYHRYVEHNFTFDAASGQFKEK